MRKIHIFLILVVVVAMVFIFNQVANHKTQSKNQSIEKPLVVGPFKLLDQNNIARASTSFDNKYLLVYFGYSYCPDICPTALSNITIALEKLGRKNSKLQPIFISVDPSRDTPEDLKVYMENFHKNFIALSGSQKQIDEAKKSYRVYSNKVDPNRSQTTDYLIDHSSIIYLISPRGEMIAHFNHETNPDYIAQVVSEKIK